MNYFVFGEGKVINYLGFLNMNNIFIVSPHVKKLTTPTP